jgi:uncharacterized protein YecT (DUF1311 family)
MIKKIIIISSLLLAQAIAQPKALAAKTIQVCENIKTTDVDFSQCLDSVKDEADRVLQTWINNQKFILEEIELVDGRSSALVMFNRSQSDFVTFRQNNCRWRYLVLSPSTKAAPAYKKCYIETTQSRIKELSLIDNDY